MSHFRNSAFLVTLLLLASCGGPKDSEVRQAFQRENPNAVVRDVYPSEGDSNAVYFTIKYSDKSTKREHRACWQYLNDGKGHWHLNFKTSVPEPAPAGYCQ